MRRAYYKAEEPSDMPNVWLPLNPSLTDISGNGYDASLVSGQAVGSVTINGEAWGDLRSSTVRLPAPVQLTYINDFHISVEIYAINWNSPTGAQYFMVVDGYDDGSVFRGIKVGSSYGTLFAAGIGYRNVSSNDGTYGLHINKSLVPTQTPLLVDIVNRNNVISVVLTNMSTGAVVASNSEASATITSVSRTFLQLGSDSRYGTSRGYNGYMRNFKLWF